MGTRLSVASALALACILTIPLRADTIVSTFDTGFEEWSLYDAYNLATYTHVATGGNPGGYLRFTDGDSAGMYRGVAPSKFLGDLRAFDGGSLFLDARVIDTGQGTPSGGFGLVYLTGGGDSAILDIAPNPAVTAWTTYSSQLTAAAWGKSQTEWENLLGNVTDIQVVVECYQGIDTMGFDNFGIESVPEPGSWLMLAIATATLILGKACRRRCASENVSKP